MKNHSPASSVKPKPKSSITSEAFLKSINKLASRDSFAPCEPVKTTPKKPSRITYGRYSAEPITSVVFKNFGYVPSKICTRCDTPLVVDTNITEYRFKHSYFMCSSCFKIAQKGYNEKRAIAKKSTFSIEKRRAELQEQIKYLMDELNYLNEASKHSWVANM